MTSEPSRSDRVAAVCEKVVEWFPEGSLRADVEAIRDRLREPLRIAVAGRAKAGKSTLVNALLGRRIAPTDVSECTRVVTWFRYGFPETIEIIPRDGSRRRVPFEDDAVPRELGQDPATIRSIVVTISNDALRKMTIIDTPGLSSLSERASDPTEELLGMHETSGQAISEANALIFLMSQTAREDDRQALDAFAEMLGGTEPSMVRAVGALSRADTIAGGDWNRACEIADRYGEALRKRLARVVPLIGLFGETALCGFGDRDAAPLEKLVALSPAERRTMLRSVDLFRRRAPLAPGEAEQLLSRLGLNGISRCLELIDGGTRGASALSAELVRLSGVGTLRSLLEETFGQRADALKARDALTALDRISWRRGDHEDELRRLRDEVEELLLDPFMHRIRELWAAQEAAAEGAALPPELAEEVARLATDGSPAARLGLPEAATADELDKATLERAGRWNAFMSDASPRGRLVAEIAARSYSLLRSDLRGRDAARVA